MEDESIFLTILLNIIKIIIGVWSVTVVASWLGLSIPLFASFLIALFIGDTTSKIVIVSYILMACGIF